ncbi:MAG: LysM peptidoglycan-binding domain-containing protein [Bacilli bacterium]
MKKIIPITREITFRTMIGEITELELSIEHDKPSEDNVVEGSLLIKGLYKMTNASQIEEEINEKLPITIELADKYSTTNIETSIDDFYYEIINDNILRVSVTIAVNGLEEQEEVDSVYTEAKELELDLEPVRNNSTNFMALTDKPEVKSNEFAEEIPVVIKTPDINLEIKEPLVKEDSMGSIFSALEHTEETFSTYFVYIVRENDTIDSILAKYQMTKEELSNYNEIDNIKLGSKLIIPCMTHE